MSEKKVVLVFGKRGSGKSYLVKSMTATEARLVVFDTMSEYSDGVAFGTEERGELLEFWRHVYRRPHRIIYRAIRPDAEIDDIAALVFALGNTTFVVEEIEAYCNAYNISDSFAAIVQRGRHKNITLIGIAHRPHGINRLLTSQAKEIYIFATNEPRDREYLRSLLGQEIETKLDGLKQYEYVKWTDGAGIEIGKA